MLSALCETMLGRHVKPGNGRKRKRAVWPPLTHLLGNTRKQETGKGGGWDEGVSAKGGKGVKLIKGGRREAAGAPGAR